MRVTVFGGSHPRPGEPAYQQAWRLGYLLGRAGHTVLTGGYIGTMEAVSRGAAESGALVIGITCDEIEAWRKVAPNPWVQQEMRFPTLRERMYALMEHCDAALVLPGGIGTLAEVAAMWSQLQVRILPSRPLVLIGDAWQHVFHTFFHSLGEYVSPADRALLTFAPDVESAVAFLPEP
ncbi:MAG: LOG family protein [Anaerolineae bacterium]|nr:MAG: LOG family protein [Anaerolineae bacterium]